MDALCIVSVLAPFPGGIAGPVECQGTGGRVSAAQDRAQDRFLLKTNGRLYVVEQTLAPRNNPFIRVVHAPLCLFVYDYTSTTFSRLPVGQRPFAKMKFSGQRRAAFPLPAASASRSG